MKVKDILIKWLKSHGCNGLYNSDGDECGCGIDELMPCERWCLDCVPAKYDALADCYRPVKQIEHNDCNCTLCQLCAARERIEQSRDFDELLKYCDDLEELWLDEYTKRELLEMKGIK